MSFLFRKLCSFGVVWCFTFFALYSVGQQSSELRPFAPLTLKELVRQSGFIFAGTVAKIESAPAQPGQVAAQRITFRVEQAIRGVRKGQLLEVREWAGLWSFGERYRVGERVVLFLYPPGRLGLTSPVGGASGRFKITSKKQVLLDNTRAGAMPALRSTDSTQPTILVPENVFVRAIQRELGEQRRGQR